MKKILAGILICAAVFYVLCLRAYYVGFFNDDAFYIIGTRSLLLGRFAELNHPLQLPMVNYLPGYPLLLLPAALFSSLLPFQLISIVLTVLGLLLTFYFLTDELRPELVLLSIVICAFNPLTASLSGTVLSELPTFALTPLIFILARAFWPTLNNKQTFCLGALAAFAFWVRPTGALFIGAIAIALLLEKRWKPALAVGGWFALFVGPLLLRNFLARGTATTYAGEYMDSFGQNFLMNAGYYLRFLFVDTLFRWRVASSMIAAVGTALVIVGSRAFGLRGWKKSIPIYLALYFLVYAAWGKQAGRYVLPLLPMAVPFLLLGAIHLIRHRHGIWLARAMVAFSLLLSFPALKRIVTVSLSQKTPINYPPEKTFSWIRENTRPNDVFAAELDGRLYLHTDRPTLEFAKGTDEKGFIDWLNAGNVRYAAIFPTDFVMRTIREKSVHDPLAADTVRQWLHTAGFERVFSDPDENSEIYLRGR